MVKPVPACGLAVALLIGWAAGKQTVPGVKSASGLRLIASRETSDPTLAVILPGSDEKDRTIEILFPEHVTVREAGEKQARHLYLWQPGQHGGAAAWRETEKSLEYQKTFEDGLHLVARATLEDDGVRLCYEFSNPSRRAYELVYAPTDPRLTGIFHDVRLERTYVHHKEGFDLLASETPRRLNAPLNEWLPARYLASFAWPVPERKLERRDDGITYYNKSRAVDEPLIATVSSDHKWVVASFARTAGNVWSNPELTCQHVDAQVSLGPEAKAIVETKILVIAGTLEDVLKKVRAQRAALK